MPVEYKDYYKTLGVPKNAGDKDIKAAFRRLARQHHPDVNPGDAKAEERFKEINEAYEVLSDPDKRNKYDTLGADWQRYQRTGGTPGDYDWGQWGTGGGAPRGGRTNVRYGTPEDLQDMFGGGDSSFSDFFSQIFGGAAGRPGATPDGFRTQGRPRRSQDVTQPVDISLDEAFHGTLRVLQMNDQRLEVKIPRGARTGTRVRVSGSAGAAGMNVGDIYLQVNVLSDPRFERKEDDLLATVPVDLYTMLLGGELQVPTLEGNVLLRIPPGTQNGRSFRLRGKGMPHLRQPDERGDLLARVEVVLPTKLTPRQRELLEELRKSE